MTFMNYEAFYVLSGFILQNASKKSDLSCSCVGRNQLMAGPATTYVCHNLGTQIIQLS
jgi:hypothetical protein